MLSEKLQDYLTQKPLYSVLVIGGLFGLMMGLAKATWQDSVNTGQILAGLVNYPLDNPSYLYHLKGFALVNHLSAILMYLTDSEIISSYIISGLLGAITFQALALLIFAINKDAYISLLGVLFIYMTKFFGEGRVYPIVLLGYQYTYGIIGLSFIILVIALIGSGANKSGAFCLGLAPYVHPCLGSWLYLIMFFSALFQLNFAKKLITKYYWYFIGGFLISVLGFFYQLHLMQALPEIDPQVKKQIYDSYVKYWDVHRVKFYNPIISFDGFYSDLLFILGSSILSFLSLRFFKSMKDTPQAFILTIFAISGPLALVFAGISHLPPASVPLPLLVLMPGRLVNLNVLVFSPLLLGILACYFNKHFKPDFGFLILAFLLSFHIHNYNYPPQVFSTIGSIPDNTMMILAGISFLWFAYITTKELIPGKLLMGARNILILFLLGGVLFSVQRNHNTFEDRSNNQFLAKFSQRKGVVAFGGEYATSLCRLFTIKTRRPMLINMYAFNEFSVAPETAEILNNILTKVYGVNLLIPPPESFRNMNLHPVLYKSVWEKRTLKAWQSIRKEFGVTDVLTDATWNISLPLVYKDVRKKVYEIPL